MLEQIREWEAGMKELPAGDYNELVRVVKLMWETLNSEAQGYGVERILGQLDHDGNPEYDACQQTDVRYHVKAMYCSNASGNPTSQISLLLYASDDPRFRWFTATNLAHVMWDVRSAGHTHIGAWTQMHEWVECFRIVDQQGLPVTRWYFWKDTDLLYGKIDQRNTTWVRVDPCTRAGVTTYYSIQGQLHYKVWLDADANGYGDLAINDIIPIVRDEDGDFAYVGNAGALPAGGKGDILYNDANEWVVLTAPTSSTKTYALLVKNKVLTWTELTEFVCPEP